MIRGINIAINAAHPELPLVEATTFVGSPSSVFVRGVPKSCGNWRITAVSVAVTYPDNTTTTRVATESAQGVWVATIPGTATSGRTIGGFRILADGEDENGAAVTGYVLGFADFAVFSMLPVPAPGETFYLFRYFDAQPATPKKGDAAIIGGVLKYYNGTAWTPFADLSNYYTKAETDAAIERVAAYYITADAQGHAFATYAALVSASTYYSGGVARVPTRNDYAVVLADETHDGAEYRYIYAIADGATSGQWEAQYPIETNDYTALANKPQINGNTLAGNKTGAQLGLLNASAVVAPSTSSADSGKAADAKATGDALALVAPEWASGNTYAAYDAVKYNGAYYYALQTIANSTTAPSSDTTNWGLLANLAAIAKLFLPLTGGNVSRYVRVVSREPGGYWIEMSGQRWSHGDSEGGPTLYFSPPQASGTLALLENLAAEYSTSGTYALNALCEHNGKLYRCKTAITTAEAWTAAHWDVATVEDVLAALRTGKANKVAGATAGNLAALDANGNPTDAGWTAGELARYSLVAKTIDNGAVTLDDRAINAVAVSSSLASLTINFPTATSGKARDFGLRLTVGSGITTAPELVLPQGIVCENADGTAPEIGADGAATILYFTETASGVFLVKGEVVTAIS